METNCGDQTTPFQENPVVSGIGARSPLVGDSALVIHPSLPPPPLARVGWQTCSVQAIVPPVCSQETFNHFRQVRDLQAVTQMQLPARTWRSRYGHRFLAATAKREGSDDLRDPREQLSA